MENIEIEQEIIKAINNKKELEKKILTISQQHINDFCDKYGMSFVIKEENWFINYIEAQNKGSYSDCDIYYFGKNSNQIWKKELRELSEELQKKYRYIYPKKDYKYKSYYSKEDIEEFGYDEDENDDESASPYHVFTLLKEYQSKEYLHNLKNIDTKTKIKNDLRKETHNQTNLKKLKSHKI